MNRLLPLLLLAACAADPIEDPCAAAAEHMLTCTGVEGLTDSTCSPAMAQRVLDTDCATLSAVLADPKADWAGPFAAFACRIGIYAACPTPVCEDDEGLGWPEEETDCSEWQAYSGCATCEYYRCREAHAGCGEEGYLLGYVGRYCDRFASVTEPRVSPAARAWLGRVRGCLIDWLETNVPYEASCEDIDRLGTDSHTVCYIETGFCELSVRDWAGIIASIDQGDIPLRVALRTAHGCLPGWFGL